MPPGLQAAPARVVLVAARDEEDRIAATLAAVRAAFPAARLVVADSGSRDRTAAVAAQAGAEVVRSGRTGGKGAAMTAAARTVAQAASDGATVLLCDGDLGGSAGALAPLAEAVESGRCDLAVAVFARRRGGGFGIAVGFARRVLRMLVGIDARAPISGQRALRGDLLPRVLPFAAGFGMEIGMTVDAVRAGGRVEEVELDLDHRATGRTIAGFLHRGRQLAAFARVYLSRRFSR